MSPLERAPRIISAFISQHGMSTSAWHRHQRGNFGMVPTSHPALLLEALPRNVGVPSLVTLLLSHHGKANLSLGILGYLEKVAITSV